MSVNFPMNWKNSLNLKVGAEFAASNLLTLRAGYAYNGSPVPETTVFPVFPAVVQNHLMLGASNKVSDPISIHAAFETALNNSVSASNNSLIANEYNGSASDLATTLIHFAFTYRF